jgi:hypothetical protein
MAKHRNAGPTRTPHDTASSASASLEEQTRALLDKLGQDALVLEQWIAHYLAELLERANDPRSTPRTRSEARAEVARVVPALWEQQIAREAVHVRQQVDYWLRRTDKLDAEAEQLLIPLLANPQKAAALPESKLPDALRALQALNQLATRLVVTRAGAEATRSEVPPEAVQWFLERDQEVQGLQAALARMVPAYASLDRSDSDAASTLLLQTLHASTRAQLALLDRVSGEPLPKPRKRPPSKKRQTQPSSHPPAPRS